MSYTELNGNLFNSNAMSIVNTVNCIGAMGKGVALEFKLRYPKMFEKYQNICDKRLLKPGQIWPYRKQSPWILNFAIKNDWHQPSKIEWIEETLIKFTNNYKDMGITSVAFPWMGAMNGGIPVDTIKSLMRKYLSNLDDIDVEVYDFNPNVSDPLFENLKKIVSDRGIDLKRISEKSNIQPHLWRKIINVMNDYEINSLYNLLKFKTNGKNLIGKTTVEKLYYFLSNYEHKTSNLRLKIFEYA